jgi:hypothetical protein
MNRKLIASVAAALVLIAAAYAGGGWFLGSVVKAGINRLGPRLTQTRVELAAARVSPLTGRGTLSGFVVGNPRGWSDNPALTCGRVHVEVAPFSLFGDHIVVKDVEISAPEFNYETRMVASNIGDLLKQIEGASAAAGPAGDAATREDRPIRFEVKRFRLTDGHVRLGVGPTALVLPMPPLELDNLGTAEGGITANELATAVMRSLASGVVATTTQAMGKVGATMGAAVGDRTKKAIDGLKGLFSGKN